MSDPSDAAFHFEPRTDTQRAAVAAWKQSRILFLLGPAGTGKSHLALALAVQEAIRSRSKSKTLMLSRPLVQCDEDTGFLPGTLEEKLGPWLAPFRDVAKSCVASKDPWAGLQRLLRDRDCVTEAVPVGMLRGRTISYGTLVCDEFQNASRNQIVCALTRLGEHGRIVVCADPSQRDLPGKAPVLDVVARLSGLDGVNVVEFGLGDIVRDPLISQIITRLS